jgi:hypothetical protein
MEGEPQDKDEKKEFNKLSHNTKKLIKIEKEEKKENYQPKIY